MEFDRHDRARSLLMELVAEFVRNEANTNPLITITNVMVAPNYRNVTVFFTTIPDTKQDDALIFLKRKGTELRQYIKKNGRFKFIPNIAFEIDYGERHRQHIDEITQQIEKGKE